MQRGLQFQKLALRTNVAAIMVGDSESDRRLAEGCGLTFIEAREGRVTDVAVYPVPVGGEDREAETARGVRRGFGARGRGGKSGRSFGSAPRPVNRIRRRGRPAGASEDDGAADEGDERDRPVARMHVPDEIHVGSPNLS